MSFAAAPWLLTGLLVIVVLLLHSHRKMQVEVPSLMLWRALALPPGTRQSRRRWPPMSLPLILQVAAVVLATLALALPHLGERRSDHLILVLDGSAPMAVDEGGESRFDLARSRVAEMLAAAGDVAPRQISLVLADADPRAIAARWDGGRADLAPVLEQLAPSATAADWPATARLVAALAGEEERTRILLLSSSATAPALDDLGAERIAIGSDSPRAELEGWVRRGVGENQWLIDVFVTFHGGLETTNLTVGYAEIPGVPTLPWAERTLTVEEDGTDKVALSVSFPGPGVLTLALDGVVQGRYVLDVPALTAPVLYIGPGEQPLIQALQVQPGLSFYQADALPEDLSGFAAVLVDRTEVARQPDIPVLWIGNAGVAGTAANAAITAPDPDDWSRTHAIARALDWRRLSLQSATPPTLPPGAEMLVSAAGQPLVAALDGPGARQVWLGFDPSDSNWPESPDLALFAGAVMGWFGITLGEETPLACTVAVACAVPGLTPGKVLTDESGATRTLADGEFRPAAPGFYTFSGSNAAGTATTGLIAVNPGASPAVFAAQEGAIPALPRDWSLPLILGALLCIAADTLLAGRRRGRIGLPPPLGVVATLLAVLALIPAPLPLPEAARVVMAEAAVEPADTALALAGAAVPPGAEGVLVLQEAPMLRPDGATLARTSADLAARGASLRIDHLPASAPDPAEIVTHSPDLPPAALEGEPVALTLRINAGAAVDTTLRLYRDGEEMAAQPVSLSAGANRIETILPPGTTGPALIEAAVDAQPGDDPANNRAGRYLSVPEPRPVAVIAADPDHGAAMVNLLAAEGLVAEVMAPRSMPEYLRGWLPWGGAVLLNTPAIAMTQRQQEILGEAVGTRGLGLLMLGGASAFGPGGYYETPLEDLSPLSSRVPRDAPEVGMVFVLDRSGSMQQEVGAGNRLDVAKRATLAAIDLLNPESQVGIVVFDSESQVVLPFGPLDREAAERALDGVDPGGGTAIYPGLVSAWEMLGDSQSPARHVIVMTDGLSQPGDWPTVIEQLRGLGATVSGVAIGQGSDRTAVEIIAALGGGAAHVTSDFAALPSILSQEAMMFAAPLEEGPTQPEWRDTGLGFLAGMPGALPPISGFVLTTAKPEARLILTTPDAEGEDAPLMAHWRYGNGQVLAFASDATGPWTENWHALPGYGSLWADALRAFQPLIPGPGLTLTADSDGEVLTATLIAQDRDGAPVTGLAPRLTLASPGGTEVALPMAPTGPGLYAAALPITETGRHALTAESDGDQAEALWHHSWPAALGRPAPETAVWLSTMTGGSEITADQAAALTPGTAWNWRAAFRPWLVLALITFMAELIRRYAEILPVRIRRTAPNRTAPAPA